MFRETFIPASLSMLTFKVLRRNMIAFLKFWKSNLMFVFIEPFLYLLALGYGLGYYIQDIQGLPFLHFLAPGLIISSAMWSSSFECTYGSFTRMNLYNLYHSTTLTPVSLDDVVMADLLYGCFKSVVSGTAILLVSIALGLVLSPWAVLVLPVLLFSGFVFAQISMIWTSLAPNFDSFAYYFTLIITPMFLFSGIFFPIDSLPEIVQKMAWVSPLYHSVEITRSLATGQVSYFLFVHMAMILFLLVIIFNVPLRLMKRRLIQ